MVGRRRVPVLRMDRLTGSDGELSRDMGQSALVGRTRYSFAPRPPELPLSTAQDLDDVLASVGTGEGRAVARFSCSVGEREISVEALGSARLDQLVLRWADTAVKGKATMPWYFAMSKPTGSFTHIPLGDIPANYRELNPDDYENYPGLDLASVPDETVMSAAQARRALKWFLTAWPDETRPVLDWIAR